MSDKCGEHSGVCQSVETLEENVKGQFRRIHDLETRGCAVGVAIKETLTKLDQKLDQLTLAALATLGSMIVGLILLILKK